MRGTIRRSTSADEPARWHKEHWPQRHPLEINGYGNLAKAFRMKGYYEEALTAYQKALAIQHQFFGSSHVNTARFYQRIGTDVRNYGVPTLMAPKVLSNRPNLLERQRNLPRYAGGRSCWRTWGW